MNLTPFSKSIVLFVCLLVLSFSGESLAKSDCTFDHAFLVKYLKRVASRNPGGIVNSKNESVTWALRNGEVVTVGHGGCADLGTGVHVTFPIKRSPKQAIRILLAAISKYWSAQDSKSIASVLAKKKLEATVNGDIEVDVAPSSAFPYLITLTLSEKSVDVAWQEL